MCETGTQNSWEQRKRGADILKLSCNEKGNSNPHTQASIWKLYIIMERYSTITWWRHQMETFSALLVICAGNSPVPGEFPSQRPVTQSFDVFFDLRLNKPLGIQLWGWLFEIPSRSLWRHCNEHNTCSRQAWGLPPIASLSLVGSWCSVKWVNGHNQANTKRLPLSRQQLWMQFLDRINVAFRFKFH